jgi:hypothetical protein
MALTWTLSLKDALSGPAAKAAGGLKGLAKAFDEVKHEEEQFRKMQKAVETDLGGVQKAMAKMHAEQAKKGADASKKAFWGEDLLKIGKKIQGAGFMEVAGVAAGAAAVVGAAVLDMGADITTAGIKAGAWFADSVSKAQEFKKTMLFALQENLHSKEAAQAAFDKTTKTALFVGGDFKETMLSFNSLLARGFKADFADQMIRALADLKTRNPNAELQAIANNIGKIQAQGWLQGDELNALGEAGLDLGKVRAEIAKIMKLTDKPGKPVAVQIAKLQSQAKIDSKTAIDAIMASLKEQGGGAEFGAAANAKANNSLEGMANRAKMMQQALLANVNIDWSPATRALDKVMSAFESPKGQQFLQSIGDGISSVLSRLDKITPEQLESALDKGAEAAKQFAAFVGAILDLTIALGPEISAVGGTITSAFQGGTVVLEAVAHGLDAIHAGLNGDFSGAAEAIGASIDTGIVRGIVGGQGAIDSAIASACLGAIGVGNKTNEIHSPSKVYERMFRQNTAGAALGIIRGTPDVVAANENMSRAAAGGVGFTAGRNLASVTNNSGGNSSSRIDVGAIHIHDAKDGKGLAGQLVSELQSMAVSHG